MSASKKIRRANLLLFAFCLLMTSCDNKTPATAIRTEAAPASVSVSNPGFTSDKADLVDGQYGTPYCNVPSPRDVVIYQVNLRSFSPQGNFAGVLARLDAIKALGVNVLYLLPIYPVGELKGVNSPYCVRVYTAVNSEFGTMADLRTLVAEAHRRKMAVILDWVADHTSWDNAWIHNKSWYRQDASGNIISPPNTDWKDVAKLDFHNSDMRKAMIDAMKFWVYQANIDGFRCDAADFIPSDFWLQAIDSLRAIPSHQLLMFAEGSRKDLFVAGFQLEYGISFYENMINNIYGKRASVRSIDAINIGEYLNASADDRVVRYTSNHDVDLGGTPLDLLDGKGGSMAAFVVAALMKGVPMIYDGQEVGCPIKLNFLSKNGSIDWTLNPEMTKQYEKIIDVRNRSEAIRKGALLSFSSDDVCAFTKSYKTQEVLVLANLRNSAESITLPSSLVNTVWKDDLGGNNVTLTSNFKLQPYEYQILETENQDALTQAMNATVQLSASTSALPNPEAKVFLSVPGAYEGWNPATAPLLPTVPGKPGMFEGYVNITGSGPQSFKFTSAPDWTHTDYGDGGNGTLTSDGKAAGLGVTDGGYYELTADLNAKKWTATKTTWSIIGDCTPGGWQTDTPMSYDPDKQVWTVTTQMTTAGSFKFRANKEWKIDFGVDDGDNLQYADNPFFPYNSNLKNLTVAADGRYTITLDLHVPGRYTYTILAN